MLLIYLYLGGLLATLMMGVIYIYDDGTDVFDVVLTSVLWPAIFSYGIVKRVLNWED